MKKELYRNIPKIDDLLLQDHVVTLIENNSRNMVLNVCREVLDTIRKEISALEGSDYDLSMATIVSRIERGVQKKNDFHLKRVINGTGVVVHTNLGRSSLAESIREQLIDVSMHYSTLEFDTDNGKRGSRYSHVEDLLCELTGAEAAMVVNNNAAAVMLVLSTLAGGKEVVVSRGQLVEIGGSFRIPEVMKLSGAKLVEVGATNKTHLRDYSAAITEETALLLKVHTSNFKVLGFTQEVSSKDLCALAHGIDLPVYDDLGSGMLIDLSKFGLMKEPTVQECIADGIDVVSFSGDKMLGGPQAGIIVGKKKYIEAMKKNQLTRALRVDKMTLAALEGTLKFYRDELTALDNVPTLKMLTKKYQEISEEACLFASTLGILDNISYRLEDDYSEVGGGSMPLEKLLSKVLVFTHNKIKAQDIIKYLRDYKTSIIGRIKEEEVIIDFRTVSVEEQAVVMEAIRALDKI
ncbi:L-seryl-tRNA(Sec) selenium transferase [Acidaminobacter sp. JC074]|uniref:L-seryl-tRNA(Sec) selenium transferase n=1 Tax=Acidaminobacter sp. JC074 TaxID=2530199 RepID=UPI001F0D67AE|nr:L-seryl-tRNA(Sec) selenium transferase [Acidaminobacter sp. JC074]MCH4886696.1 L-seryl-tRNA(Sec) selenium transferase [Acidaminobacter sp. JC074]